LAELLRLPPSARAVLYLAEVEGYRYDEIAQMLGCTATTARKRASRARRHLRLALGVEA
jgi:RNA polymerase sigma-70 factor (ECF subfamily)